tara:strand:+ start:1260 stop:1628 length:369 start_codon:yes stop_codon:yes gene_type:complete
MVPVQVRVDDQVDRCRIDAHSAQCVDERPPRRVRRDVRRHVCAAESRVEEHVEHAALGSGRGELQQAAAKLEASDPRLVWCHVRGGGARRLLASEAFPGREHELGQRVEARLVEHDDLDIGR